jgi:glutamyl-tRNA reductase
MGGHAIKALRERGVQHIRLTNRTYQRAYDMAEKFGGQVLPFEELKEGLVEADVVFTSTSASSPILRRELALEVMACRPHRPLTVIDLAVPRNVETRVQELPNVQLFDMDDLQIFVDTVGADYHPDLARAKAITKEEVADYEKLLRIIPFIGELHKKVEGIRQREVERVLRNFPSSDSEVRDQIELLSRSLVQKILHEPTMHLRTETNQETLNEYVDALGQLFDLDEDEPRLSLQ